MKKLTLLIAITFIVTQVKSQEVSIAGKRKGLITINELLSTKSLKVEVKEGGAKVTSFTVGATIKGFEEEARSRSSIFSAQQKHLIKKLLPGQNVYFEDIKIKLQNGQTVGYSILKFTIDGPNAHFDGWNTISDILKKPYLYVYPNFSSKDTSQFKVTSFKIKSSQPDYYYEFKSNSNMLTPEMIGFAKKATFSFWISDIKAVDQNNITQNLLYVPISINQNTIQRTKKQLAKAKTLDLISPKANLKVKSFKLWKTGEFEKEEDKYITGKNDVYTKDMKEYIKSVNVGDIIEFSMDYADANGKDRKIWLKMKIVE